MKQRKKQSPGGERVLISFDYALKRLLRNKSNYDVLEGFLSELLMTDISVKNIGESESNKEHATDKSNRVDILVEDESGEIMLIELQFNIELDYLQRMLYGTSKAITERMVHGTEYMEVKKVYSINIVYFNLGQGEDYVYHGKTHFTGLHKKDELQLSEEQRKVFKKEVAGDIYPEYYILKVNNFDDRTKDQLDEWIYFFKHNAVKDEFKAKGLDKAREILDRDKLTPEEQKAYDAALWERSKKVSDVASSKEVGRTEGIEIGRKIGREEGRIEREKLVKELEKREEREKELLAELTRLKQNKQNNKNMFE
ncbi:MAG: Rpn family recombination-promoting nuclease/putative transposase [Planctomycetaceae bacterium]|jgi:predicted transposase/invertase (TIGR01784 family)|nr:Rpn family recombination-promoting nuclease/putative transposase [Planctomycetaceae bacterium]